MNPKTPIPSTSRLYSNGHDKAPLESSGASLPPPPSAHVPTTFAADLPLRGLGPILYGLSRFQLVAMPLGRGILLFFLLVAFLAAIGILPGQWITATILVLLTAGLSILNLRLRRAHYVTFSPVPPPAMDGSPLQTNEKIPIYATGLLGVEGRYQRYTVLPGFYRTFATGEHAILCRLRERTWLGLLTWPLEEAGMWYAFVNPSDIQQLAWGTLGFGSTSMSAIKIEYRLELPPGPRRKRAAIRHETLYVASQQPGDAKRLYLDLRHNLLADKILVPLSAQS